MGTRSLIGVQRNDGSVRYAYCHYDGYLEGVGKEVVSLDRAEANKLINMGDMRCVGEPFKDGSGPKLFGSARDFAEKMGKEGAEFAYLLTKGGTWKYVTYNDRNWRSLKLALRSLKDG